MSNERNLEMSKLQVRTFVEGIAKQAKMNGIMVTGVFVHVPRTNLKMNLVTPYGKDHPELVIESCNRIKGMIESEQNYVEEETVDEW